MKSYVKSLAVITLLAGLCFMSQVFAQGVESLRGMNDIDQTSKDNELKRWADDGEPITRDFIHQPPLIPHDIQGYKINLKFNKCLTCHSWANYKSSGATKVSITHYNDRNNNAMAVIAPRRYFCNQCHVPQTNARPLVENNFQPIQTLQ